jgi:hypothetical protein
LALYTIQMSISTHSVVEYLKVRTAASAELRTDSLAALVSLADKLVAQRVSQAIQPDKPVELPTAQLNAAEPKTLYLPSEYLPEFNDAESRADSQSGDLESIAQLVQLASDVIQRL